MKHQPAVRVGSCGLCCSQGAGHGHCSAAAADKNNKVAPGVGGLSDVFVCSLLPSRGKFSLLFLVFVVSVCIQCTKLAGTGNLSSI